MSIWIVKLDSNSTIITSLTCVAPGVDAETAATAMGWGTQGTNWRICASDEANDGGTGTLQAPTLSEFRESKLTEVMTKYSAKFATLEKVYPPEEREGWYAQEAEAKAYLADNTVETPALSLLVQLRGKGETVIELARKVLANVAIWTNMYAWYTGQQQKMYADVSALTTTEDVKAYQVVYQTPPTIDSK